MFSLLGFKEDFFFFLNFNSFSGITYDERFFNKSLTKNQTTTCKDSCVYLLKIRSFAVEHKERVITSTAR